METRSRKKRQVAAPDTTTVSKRARRDNSRRASKTRPRIGLEDLPVEILQAILFESLELNLIHTSSRLRAALPEYRDLARRLLMLCFLDQTFHDDDDFNNAYSIAEAERYQIPGFMMTPIFSREDRLVLQRQVLNSGWCQYDDLLMVTDRLLPIHLKQVFDDFDLSPAQEALIKELSDNSISLFCHEEWKLTARKKSGKLITVLMPNPYRSETRDATIVNFWPKPDETRAVASVLCIPEKLLKAPFTDEKFEMLCYIRCMWDPIWQQADDDRAASFDPPEFDRDLIRPAILALIAQEDTAQARHSRKRTTLNNHDCMLLMLLELETVGLLNSYKMGVLYEYFEAAILGGKVSSLRVLMIVDSDWQRLSKAPALVEWLKIIKPRETSTSEIVALVEEVAATDGHKEIMKTGLSNCSGIMRAMEVRDFLDLWSETPEFL
jgi:hypothetical protein